LLSLTSLSKKFPGQIKPAVENITFKVKQGEAAVLLGENGAGKTTLLRIISTMLKPDSGTCNIMGYDSQKESGKVRENIGMLLGGETGLYDRLTARENIEYFADLHGIPRSMQKKNIAELAFLLGMEDYLDKRCGTFSRGMKQKTSFARSLIHNPPVILLDEPTTGLDVSSSKTVRDFIRSCRDDGRTILFSSHNIDEVKKLADRIIIIHSGIIQENSTLEELIRKFGKDLESAFLKITGAPAENGLSENISPRNNK
jgi:sodium transport system ATP-binding protein